MRSAGNFSPEWGYLAPVPSFLRTVRVVVVATAIGATAGAGVVLSLVEHPAPEVGTAAVAAHAIVTSALAATGPGETATRMPAQPRPVIATQSPQIPAPQITAPQIPASQIPASQIPASQIPASQIPAVSSQSVSPSATSAAPALQSVPGVAALTEGTPSTDAAPAETPDQASIAPTEELPQKKSAPKHAWPPYPANAKNKPTPGMGTVLRHLFTAHAGTAYYPNR